jgi:signal transduction histidine kinase
VFEIYSDVTPLLRQMDAYTASIEGTAAANQAQTESTARNNQRKVDSSSAQHFIILGSLLALLYTALWVLVRYAQSVIDEQARARAHAAVREHAAYREKMAALATMAANASHDIGNPLAVIAGLADELERAHTAGEPVGGQPAAILEQASRIAEMSRRITQFASARSEVPEAIDLNEMVASVCQFLAFDDRFRGIRIEPRLASQLPACIGIPDHLNEVLMSLLEVHAETGAKAGAHGRLVVATSPVAADVAVSIACECDERSGIELPASDPRLESARRRVAGMGGRLGATATRTTIVLPALRTPQPA